MWKGKEGREGVEVEEEGWGRERKRGACHFVGQSSPVVHPMRWRREWEGTRGAERERINIFTIFIIITHNQ